MFKRFSFSEVALAISGYLLFSHYRLIGWTNRIRRIPDGSFFEPFEKQPVIIALWHGEHFLMPFFGWRKDRLNILVTIHRDGEILVRAGQRFGLKFIRGSGDHGPEFVRKKALRAFTAMVRLLKHGESVVMTADVPKVARVAGLGIVDVGEALRLSDRSGRHGDQPAAAPVELGPHADQPAVRAHGHGARRADPGATRRRRRDARSVTPHGGGAPQRHYGAGLFGR